MKRAGRSFHRAALFFMRMTQWLPHYDAVFGLSLRLSPKTSVYRRAAEHTEMKLLFRLPREDGERKPRARSGKGYTVSWATVNHVGPILALDGSVFCPSSSPDGQKRKTPLCPPCLCGGTFQMEYRGRRMDQWDDLFCALMSMFG